jgi:hypothetical protein
MTRKKKEMDGEKRIEAEGAADKRLVKKYLRRVMLVTSFIALALISVLSNATDDPTYVEISNLTSYNVGVKIIIYWDTNTPADTLVLYGLSPDNLSESSYTEVNTYAHAAELTGLQPLTTYYCAANSTNTYNASNQSDVYSFTTQQDSEAPQYSSSVAEPLWSPLYQVNYSPSQNYTFSTVWEDNTALGQVTITHDFDGNTTTLPLSPANGSSALAAYTYTHGPLVAGTYKWGMTASDAYNNTNQTPEYTYIVSQSAPGLRLLLGGTEGSITLEQKSYLNITGTILSSEGPATLKVYNSSATLSQVTLQPNQTLPAELSLPQYFDAPGLYSVEITHNSTQNYTEGAVSYTVNVTPIEASLFLDKTNYSLGENVNYAVLAPNQSNLTVEVCGPLPTGSGFVQCYTPVSQQPQNYPYSSYHTITNKSGTYRQRAQITYKGLTKTAEKNYTVMNSLLVTISGNTTLKTGEQSKLTASAAGGVGTLTYVWTLSNGTRINGQNLNIHYNTAGSYPVIATVTDSAGNTNSQAATLTVKNHYIITVLVTDAASSPLESASVKFGDLKKETDIDGKTSFDLYAGDYTYKASASGYKSYSGTWTADANETVTVKLAVQDAAQAGAGSFYISLISPQDFTVVNAGSTTFQANVNLGSVSGATCQFFISDGGSGWYRVMETKAVSASGAITHTENLDGGLVYSWKVQCDTSAASYGSDVYNITVLGTDGQQPAALTVTSNLNSPIMDAGEIRNRIEDAMTNMEGLDMESKKDAESLLVPDRIGRALTNYDRAMRDINSVIYRRDLTAAEQEAKKLEYYNSLKALENTTPYNLKTTAHETFIAYPSKEELINISKDYQEARKIEGKLNQDRLSELQNKVIITTRASVVDVVYINGRTETLTLVAKTLKLSDNATDTFLLEAVPKELAESSDEIVLLGENTMKVIRKDPMLRLDKQQNITYYVVGQKDLAAAKKSQTLLLSDNVFSAKGAGMGALTGAVTFTSIQLTSPTTLVVLVALVSCIYLLYAFNVFGSLKGRFGRKSKEGKINDILNLIRDGRYFLQNNELDKADMVFREIRMKYENSPDEVRAEVYNDAEALLEAIDTAQVEMLIRAAEQHSMHYPGQQPSEKDIEEAQASRETLKRAYELLSGQLREKYDGRIKAALGEGDVKGVKGVGVNEEEKVSV